MSVHWGFRRRARRKSFRGVFAATYLLATTLVEGADHRVQLLDGGRHGDKGWARVQGNRGESRFGFGLGSGGGGGGERRENERGAAAACQSGRLSRLHFRRAAQKTDGGGWRLQRAGKDWRGQWAQGAMRGEAGAEGERGECVKSKDGIQSRPESEIKVEGGYERTITRSVAFFGGLVAVSLVESHGHGGGQAARQVLLGLEERRGCRRRKAPAASPPQYILPIPLSLFGLAGSLPHGQPLLWQSSEGEGGGGGDSVPRLMASRAADKVPLTALTHYRLPVLLQTWIHLTM